jgi:hypothetical protein
MKIIKIDELNQGDEILLGSNSSLRRVMVKSVPKETTKRSWGNYSSIKCDILNNDLEDYTVVRKDMYLDLNFRDILVIKSKNKEI